MYITPELWKSVGIDLGAPDPELFDEAFALCRSIRDQILRESCFGGFGKEFVPLAASCDIRRIDQLSDETYQRAISWCESAGLKDAIGFCVAEGLDSIFWGGENDPEASFRYCGLVADSHTREICFVNLGRNIQSYVRDDTRREALCARLPEVAQSECMRK